MKILLVHNYYRSGAPGGEDVVFEQERDLLLGAGHEVFCYTRSNDEMDERRILDQARVAIGMQRSQRTLREIRSLIFNIRPQVAHFHNVFPLISASGYEACVTAGVPVVQTVHNFRMACSAAIHFRNGSVCESCTPSKPWAAVQYGCYRDSRVASLAVAATIYRNHHRGVYRNFVTRFIALTGFAARRLIAMGVSSDRITVKPNFVSGLTDRENLDAITNKFVFVGRLAEEKGVKFLLEAWKQLADVPLALVGDGPLRPWLEEYVRRHVLPVEFVGMQERSVVTRIVSSARGAVIPSLCFEGGVPLTLLEAMAVGTPVIASRFGGIPELLTDDVDGLLFDPGNISQLVTAVKRVATDSTLRSTLAERARNLVHHVHGRENNLQALIAIYDSVSGGSNVRL